MAMKTREIRADAITTRDAIVEGGNGVKRVALKVAEWRQDGGRVEIRVRLKDDTIAGRAYGATDKVRVLKRRILP